MWRWKERQQLKLKPANPYATANRSRGADELSGSPSLQQKDSGARLRTQSSLVDSTLNSIDRQEVEDHHRYGVVHPMCLHDPDHHTGIGIGRVAIRRFIAQAIDM